VSSTTEEAPLSAHLRESTTQLTAAVRVLRTMEDLPAAFGEYLPKVGEATGRAGLVMAGAPYARYHGMGEQIDVEIGVPVVGPDGALPPLDDVRGGDVGLTVLPHARVAVTMHVGPYEGLGATWRELEAWLREHSLETAGAGWESYVDDPDEVPAESLRTELVIPVR
jgi:effector-binding domain-containing protein